MIGSSPSFCRRSQRFLALPLALLWSWTLTARAQDDAMLKPFVVTGEGPSPWEGSVGYSGETLDREEMALRPGSTLSDQLSGLGGFRLFRRQSALASHPTTHGASLRVAGPSGASRANVYLDGVPLNDAFGGWIPWTAVSSLELSRTSLVQPSGLDPWGNVSLGGTLWLESRRLDPFFSLEGAWGNRVEHHLSNAFLLASPDGRHRIRGSWSSLQSGGYHVIRSDQRGPLDRPATVQADAVMLAWDQDLGDSWTLDVGLRYHQESRGNGTPLATNEQEAWMLHGSLVKERRGDPWEGRLTGYWQDRTFASVFTSVDDQRRNERPVLDQFDVPSRAMGLIWRSRHWWGPDHETLLGIETHFQDGETHERSRNLGSGFTRQRRAGGQRWDHGVVVDHTWRFLPNLALKGSGRVDHRLNRRGEDTTWDLETGERLTDDDFSASRDWEPSGRLALEWEPAPAWNLHAAGFTGTRPPSLNERYRPFRVGNDITLANAELESERLWGTALGARWEPRDDFALSLEGFWHQLDDGIANVTLREGGGFAAPWGFIPEGGSGRQRRNVEEISITGLESALSWTASPDWTLDLSYLLTDSRVESSPDQPALEGRSLAQMPTHQAGVSLTYHPAAGFYARTQARWTDAVFDDDLNQRRLDPTFLVDLECGWQWKQGVTLFLSVENLFQEEIEAGKSGDGLVSIGHPRLVQAGLRLDY